MPPRPDNRRRAGFALVEVIVSIAILGGVIVGLLVARGRALRAHLAAERIMLCTQLCAGQQAAVRAGIITGGDADFDSPAGYHWRVEPAPVPEGAPSDLIGYKITVTPPEGTEDEGATATLWMLDRSKEVRQP